MIIMKHYKYQHTLVLSFSVNFYYCVIVCNMFRNLKHLFVTLQFVGFKILGVG